MSCPFVKYSNIFGEPKTGFHSFRILDVAVGDLLGTAVISGLISYGLDFNFFLVLLFFIVLGIIFHRLFCVNTTINKLIFGEVGK
jgi:uncharacterized membrane protein